MSFHARGHVSDGVATIRVSGELHARFVGQLNNVLTEVTSNHPSRLVLLLGGLTYLSSAGLRSLVMAHQRLGRDVPMVLVAAHPDVAEAIRLTAFDHSVVMQELAA
jgi:anti-sigma B factor antagonist